MDNLILWINFINKFESKNESRWVIQRANDLGFFEDLNSKIPRNDFPKESNPGEEVHSIVYCLAMPLGVFKSCTKV